MLHYLCACSRGSIKVYSRVNVLLELVEAEMRDQGGLITAKTALRYLMTVISREFSHQAGASSGTLTTRLCASVESLRIVDPSVPSTGLCSHQSAG